MPAHVPLESCANVSHVPVPPGMECWGGEGHWSCCVICDRGPVNTGALRRPSTQLRSTGKASEVQTELNLRDSWLFCRQRSEDVSGRGWHVQRLQMERVLK